MQLNLILSLVLGLLGTVKAVAIPSTELVKRTARTSPPSGCISAGTGGTYSTLALAVASLSGTGAACIFVYSGTYLSTDSITINYAGALTLYGYTTDTSYQSSNTVTLQRNINSATAGSLDASSVVNIVSDNFKAYNINFQNTYGDGAQAVAVTANADYVGFYACGFIGYQDTLYAKSGQQYYSNCYIEGAVDYAFGDAAAWFGECTFASNGGGAITATSRETTTDTTWFVIDSSTVTAASGYSLAGKVYLGRPWRVLSRVIFQNSVLTAVVAAAGWTTLAADATPIYEEFNNSGDGSDTSARLYETAATAKVTKDQLWGSSTWESWVDTSY